jgi:hypothetical protein
MRLYRGLKKPYKPEKCAARISAPAQLQGTDFTDCPYTALLYAHGPRGVVLVVDVGPGDPVQVSEELWLGMKAQRIMVWGIFHQFIRAVFPAKELRAEVRSKGIQSLSDQDKGTILKHVIEQRLAVDKPAGGNHAIFQPE